MPGGDEADDAEASDHEPRAGQYVAHDHQQEERHGHDQAEDGRFLAAQLGKGGQVPLQLVPDRFHILQRETARTVDGIQPDDERPDEEDSEGPNVQPAQKKTKERRVY